MLESSINMPVGNTTLSHMIHGLHMQSFLTCLGIALFVFTLFGYALIRFRKNSGAVPEIIREHKWIEISWIVIPAVILTSLAIPATAIVKNIYFDKRSSKTIKVSGAQWKWQYQYLDEDISFYSVLSTPYDQILNKAPKGQWYLREVDNMLVVPTKQKIRFLLTSKDVVHSWWMPDFGVKKDAIPGIITEIWAYIDEEGIYRGQCAELCGIGHGFMPIVVKAVNQEDYQQWVNEQHEKVQLEAEKTEKQWTLNELMTLGKKKYDQFCAICHQADGSGMRPFIPALQGSSVAVGEPIKRHIDIVLNGIPGTAMQAFRDQMSALDLAAIITYERNAWGNDTNDVIQPSEIKEHLSFN